jgi:hypothetical protein
MFGKNPHHGALHGPAIVEQSGRNSFNGVAMLEKLRLSRGAWRSSHTRKLIHCGVADLTLDGLAVVQHGKSVRQAFAVIAYNATARQRHQEFPLTLPTGHSVARRRRVAPE